MRTLAHDLGKKLGSAAHLTALRRESIGEHSVGDAWTIEQLYSSCEVPFRQPYLKDMDESKPKQGGNKPNKRGSGKGSRFGDDAGEEGKAEVAEVAEVAGLAEAGVVEAEAAGSGAPTTPTA